ncbi:RNA-binding protein [candidate division WWE3 bacterium]|nr:RNA-binding protein [candidate division WWE3 bacterium]
MAKKLFVGGLPYSTTEQELQDLFGQSGAIQSVQIIVDRETGRSKGFGFVEMSSDEEAANAINMFNGYELGGRKLQVNEARPMVPRGNRDNREGGYNNGGGNRW